MKKFFAIIISICFIFNFSITTFAMESKSNQIIVDGNEWYTLADIENDEEEINYYYNEGLNEINEKIISRSNFYYIAVPKYFQNDPVRRLVTMPCGHSGDTYGNVGCGMTAYAMVLKYYKHNATPESVAQTFQNNHGNCCNLNYANLLSDYNRTGNLINVEGQTLQTIATTIVGALSQDKPVVIKLNPTSFGDHFIVAYGYSVASNGTIFISVHDPWAENHNAIPLVGEYATLNEAYTSGRYALRITIVN